MQVSQHGYLPPPRLVTTAVSDLLDKTTQDPFVAGFRDVYLYPKGDLTQATPLTELRQRLPEADWKALQEAPYQSADGLIRTSNYYLAPKTLDLMAAARGWDQAADGHPIADVVVIGAGPGGLATSYHLAQKGVQVLTLEGGFAGQAFSDGGAQTVHSIRTDRQQSSLIRTGNAAEDQVTSCGLPAGLGQIVAHARHGRESFAQATGHEILGVVEGAPDDGTLPTGRAELFEHFVEVADHLATGPDNSMLIEKAPVTSLKRQDGQFCLETARGHKVYARKVVMATGLVTPGGANSKMMPVLQQLADQNPERYVLLREDYDRVAHNEELHQALTGAPRSLILSDRLLGTPEVQLALRQLPAGAHVAMVGSGESAVKGALEVLSQNPSLKVDFFTKAPLEAAQVQIPTENVHPVVLEKAIDDRDFGRASLERFKNFGTPITPRTMIQLLELQAAGRMQIFEMGAYFDEKSVTLTPQADGTTEISFANPKVRDTLRQRRNDWAAQGLKTDLPVSSNVRMIISATGYNREELRHTPLVEQMLEQGLMEICSDPQQGLVGQPLTEGLVSSRCPDLACNTSAALTTAADSAIPGMAVRGRRLAEFLASQLPSRPLPLQPAPAAEPGLNYASDFSQQDFREIAKYRGLSPQWVASADLRNPEQQNLRTFPDPDRFLRELANSEGDGLSVAEQITLNSARSLIQRLGDATL